MAQAKLVLANGKQWYAIANTQQPHKYQQYARFKGDQQKQQHRARREASLLGTS